MESRNCTTGSWIQDIRLQTDYLKEYYLVQGITLGWKVRMMVKKKICIWRRGYLRDLLLLMQRFNTGLILLNLNCQKLKQNPAKDDIWTKTVDTSDTDTHQHRMAQPNCDRPLPPTVPEWQTYLPCSQPLCYHLITLYPTALEIRRTSGCC